MFAVFSCAQEHPAHDTAAPVSSGFVDVTQKVGISFEYRASHTSRKYLRETMGPGVALFNYDNDGRLDIFLVSGAPLLEPTPKTTIPAKTRPEYWNPLFHQKSDGTFEDATEKAGPQGFGYGMGVAVGDYDLVITIMMASKIFTSQPTAETDSTTTTATAHSPT